MESFAPQFMVSKEQAARENRRLRSVYGGKFKFISLILNDIRRRNICGVEVVQSTAFRNEAMGGVQDYQHEVMGGSIKFEFNEAMGVWRYDLLDSDHNRQFLASMWDRDFWEIEDVEVKKDIERRAKEITKSMIIAKEPENETKGSENETKGSENETIGSLSHDMQLEHADPLPPAKRRPGPRPIGKMDVPDSPIGQIKNDDGIVTMGARVKQV
jgi:hypothetical protein